MTWDAKKNPNIIGPGNFPDWMTKPQKAYYTWLRTASDSDVWKAFLTWTPIEGQAKLNELMSELERRGYDVPLNSPAWHTFDRSTDDVNDF